MNKLALLAVAVAIALLLLLFWPRPQAALPVAARASERLPTALPVATAPTAAPLPGLGVAIAYDQLTPSSYRFDLSASRTADGRPLDRFELDFGDGTTATSKDGVIEHAFPYRVDHVTQINRYTVRVTGFAGSEQASETVEIRFANEWGRERAEGFESLETQRCVLAYSVSADTWGCSTVMRNLGTELVTLDHAGVTISPPLPRPGERLPPPDPVALRAQGLRFELPAGSLPASIAPGAAVPVRFEIPASKVPEGAAMISIGVIGHGASGQPVSGFVRGTLGPRDLWSSARP